MQAEGSQVMFVNLNGKMDELLSKVGTIVRYSILLKVPKTFSVAAVELGINQEQG